MALPMMGGEALKVTSPKEVNEIVISQTNGALTYTVTREGAQIIAPSRLGLEMDNEQWEHALAQYYPQYESWMEGFTVDSVSYSQHLEVLRPLYGELLEHRYLIDNLNEPNQIADAAEWVKPGKSMRCVTLYTDDPKVETRTRVAVKTIKIKSGKSIILPLQAKGGAAMHFKAL